MRLAYFSPLPPTPSGISDYSAELLPFLARKADVEVFADVPGELVPDLPVRPYQSFFSSASEFDFPIYQMGNSPAHAYIYEASQRFPGVLVLHDIVLHHLFAWLTLERGDRRGYIELMRGVYGDAGGELARAEIERRGRVDRFSLPLSEPLIRASRAVIVHSEFAARFVESAAPGKPVAVVPMGVTLPERIEREQARARLNLPGEVFIAGVFGEITLHKRIAIVLAAFREFHARHSEALLLLVGNVSPNLHVQALIKTFGIADVVRVTGFAPHEMYENYIAACDVCINLRFPTAGETSASVLRMLAAARPAIVTRADAYTELPDVACVKIEPDEFEQDALVAHLDWFAAHPELTRAMGEHGRQFVATQHTLQGAARDYIEFLESVGTWKGRKKTDRKAEIASQGATDPKSQDTSLNIQPLIPNVQSPVPNPESAGSPGRAIAELGIEADDPVLNEIAQAMVEIGSIDGPNP